jgi:hypothetical protein
VHDPANRRGNATSGARKGWKSQHERDVAASARSLLLYDRKLQRKAAREFSRVMLRTRRAPANRLQKQKPPTSIP